MNELPLSIFELLLAADLIVIAYSLYGINFFEAVKVDKILTAFIAAPLSFILGTYIINGEVVQTYVDTNGFHYITFMSLPLYYFLTGFAILMTVLTVLLLVKFISDYYEQLEKKSSFGDWKQNSFSKRK